MQRFINPPSLWERFTTMWHGNVAAATWTHRNIASVTENGSADITLTFIQAYAATPAAVMCGGDLASAQCSPTTIAAGSLRLVVRNISNAAVAGRKTGVAIVGQF